MLLVVSQLLSLCTFKNPTYGENLFGLAGHICAWFWLTLFGINAFFILIGFGWFAGRLIFSELESNYLKKMIAAGCAFFAASLLLTLAGMLFPNVEVFFGQLLGTPALFRLGGYPFYFLFHSLPYCSLEKLLNFTGTFLVAMAILVASMAYIYDITFKKVINWIKGQYANFCEERASRKEHDLLLPLESKKSKTSLRGPDGITRSIELAPPPLPLRDPELAETRPPKLRITAQQPTFDKYVLPSLDILNMPKKTDTATLKSELKEKADLLEETLTSFGIEAKVGQIYCGPTITCFEVHPAIGVKIGKITTLENDIALNMEAKSIRIIAPIPGKAAVGIEVPNNTPQEVTFKEILTAYKQHPPFRIPMLLGKSVSGDLVMSDLAKLPHCIIAGATGSGKSVCINSIVMSLLMTTRPDEVRLLMIDPKKVELTPYSELPHMLAPVITDPQTACLALNWLVKEMEKRYEILRLCGQRNIESFNRRAINAELEANLPIAIPKKFEYYVAIVDELADLMMVASQDIETPIARIAQMARAVGIHLILATQRPSREVITGLIKANFPARIAFKVASRVNSQIILDDIGAESLLGNGDMLFLLPGAPQLIRAQGVFIRDEEIARVIEHISRLAPRQYVISSFDKNVFGDVDREYQSNDALYDEAKSVVFGTGNASTTFLQRKLKIGYARAASLMDELEATGVVGPQEGAKPRKIFFPSGSAPQRGSEDEGEEKGV